jgi:transposase
MTLNKNTTDKPFKAIIGIDLGDTKHAICVTDKRGTIRREYSIPNTRKQIEKLALEYPKALIAMEVGTHSPWISRLLQKLGNEVIVANARKLRAIYTNERKSDLLDARMIAKLARVDPDLLYPIHHSSEDTQLDFLTIKMRSTLVDQRVNIVNAVRGSLKALGIRIPKATTVGITNVARPYLEEHHPETLPSMAPMLDILDELKAKIKQLDKAIDQIIATKYKAAQLIQQIGGVGPITSLTFVLTIERAERFEDPRDVGAYIGLVPRRDQSGNTDKQLPISKTGSRYLRKLLVQCAQYNLGHFGQDSDLRRYGENIYISRGSKAAKRKAVIAVARKLSVLMLTLWQRECDYEPLMNAKKKQAA